VARTAYSKINVTPSCTTQLFKIKDVQQARAFSLAPNFCTNQEQKIATNSYRKIS
jgi:hypothetical protein